MSQRTTAGRLSTVALLWHHVRTRAGASIGVALLVLVAAAVGMAAPRAVEVLNSASLQQRVHELTAPQRDLIANAVGGPATGPAPDAASAAGDSIFGLPSDVAAVWGKQEAALRGIRNNFDPLMQSSLGEPQYTVQFTAMRAQQADAGPDSPLYYVLPTFDPRLSERVRYVEGSAPTTDSTLLPREAPVEIALSQKTAAEMEWPLGEERPTTLDSGEPQSFKLAGIFEAIDTDAAYWQHTLAALSSSIVDDGMAPPQLTSVAFVDPASWEAFSERAVSPRSHIWFPLQVDALRAPDNAALLVALREVSTSPIEVDEGMTADRLSMLTRAPGQALPVPSIGAIELSSEVVRTLEVTERANAALLTVLALTVIGPFGVMVAVLMLGSRIVANRRQRAVSLAAARGASRWQLHAVLGIEGLLIGIPAATGGAIIGTLLVPGAEPSTVGVIVATLLGLTPLFVLAVQAARFDASIAASAGRAPAARPQLRLLLEIAIVAVAVVATATLFGRGLGDGSAGVDPLLAATPFLLSLAACVVVLRLYPLPLAWIERVASHRVGLVAALGSRRALREPATGVTPVLALVVGFSVAVFSGVMLSTIDNGVHNAAQARVGADVRVASAPIASEQLEALRTLPGISAIAPVYSARSVLISADSSRTPAVLLVIDSDELSAVQTGVPGAIQPPAELRTVVDAAANEPTPVIVSEEVASLLDGEKNFRIGTKPAHIIATAPDSSALTTSTRWLMVDKANAASLAPSLVPQTVLIDLADGTSTNSVHEQLSTVLGTDFTATVPDAVASEIRGNPSIAGLHSALSIAIAIVALLSAAAVVMTLVLGAPARERLLGMLRTLGLSRGQARALLLWEIGPVATVALLAGSVLGLCLPLIVLAGVDLTPFTGGSVQPAASVDPLLMTALIGGFLVVVAAASTSALALARRASLSRAIRLEEE